MMHAARWRQFSMNMRVFEFSALTLALAVALPSQFGVPSLTAQQRAPDARKTASARGASPAAWPAHTSDGQPDITGVWGSEDTGVYSLNIEPLPYLRSLGMASR